MEVTENYEVDLEEKNKKQTNPIVVLIVIAIIFLPATIFAFVIVMLLQKFRLRPSVIFSIVFLLELFFISLWKILGLSNNFSNFLLGISSNDFAWSSLILPILIFNFMIGSIIGFFLAYWESRKLKTNPHRIKLPGSWMHNFKYRRTPIEVLKRNQKIKNLKNGFYSFNDRAPLGIDETNLGDNIVYRYNSEAVRQTLITGAAGSGKTITLFSLMKSDIDSDRSVIAIDFKKSPEFASKVAKMANDNGSDFYHFVKGNSEDYNIPNSNGQSFYDPLIGGSPTSKSDMILGMREYDTASAVYKNNMQQLLQVLLAMLDQADKNKAPNIDWDKGGILQIASVLKGSNFSELTSACEGKKIQYEAERADQEISTRGSGLKHALDELRGQIMTLTASEYGQWLKNDPIGENNIDITKLTSKPGSVILFSLDSDSEPEFAKYIGSLILADITVMSAKRRNVKASNLVNVYVDEFQVVPPDSVKGLLEKARESKIAMTLAQQSFEQIIASSSINGEAYLTSIMDTCSNFIVHKGAVEDSAERLAKIIGKDKFPTYSAFNKNENFFLSINWFNRRNQKVQTGIEDQWIFDPSNFMKLSAPDISNNFKATAIIVNKTSTDSSFKNHEGAVARKVWMIPDESIFNEHYDHEINYKIKKEIIDEIKEEDFTNEVDFEKKVENDFIKQEKIIDPELIEASELNIDFDMNDPFQEIKVKKKTLSFNELNSKDNFVPQNKNNFDRRDKTEDIITGNIKNKSKKNGFKLPSIK